MRIGRANGEGWLRLGDAAAELGVSLNTLRRWSDAGKLTCYRSPGGHRRYRRADVEQLLRTEAGTHAGELPYAQYPRPSGARGIDELRAPLLTLARVAAEGVGVTECRISLAGDGGTFLVLTAHSRIGGGVARQEVAGPQPPLPTVREVLRTGRRLVITDLSATNLLEKEDADSLRRQGDVALLAMPMTLGSRDRAVLELVETRSPRAFTGANITFADFMARQAARLLTDDDHTEAPPSLELPGDVVQDAAPVPAAEDVLTTLVERLRRELRAVACDVLRYDAEADALEPVAVSSAGDAPPLRGLLHPVADFGEVATALASGESVTVPDLAAVTAAGPHVVRRDHDGAGSLYATPIRLGHDVVGLLEVYAAEPGRVLAREELALVEAGAAAAALVLSGEHDRAVLTRRVAQLDDLIAGSGLQPQAMDAEHLVRADPASGPLPAGLQRVHGLPG